MKELATEQVNSVSGGVVLTTAIVTGAFGVTIASIWLANSMVNLYLQKKGGQNTQPRLGTDTQIPS